MRLFYCSKGCTCPLQIILNVNRLYALIKRHKVVNWILKNGPIYMLPTGDSYFRAKDTYRLKLKGLKKYIPYKWK